MEIWGYGIGGLQDLGTAGEDKNAFRVPPGHSISSKRPKAPIPVGWGFWNILQFASWSLEALITCLRATTFGVKAAKVDRC